MTKIMDSVMALAGYSLMGIKPDVASAIVATWDACLGALCDRNVMPDPKLNRLATMSWTLVHSRVVSTAMIPGVPTLAFMGLVRGEKQIGVIAIPEDWLRQFATDPWMQLGAIVYSTSKARDLWADKLLDGRVEERAKAFEARFLRLAVSDASTSRPFKPNDYQTKVLTAFPAFPEEIDYEPEPFDLARARARFEDFSERGIRDPAVA